MLAMLVAIAGCATTDAPPSDAARSRVPASAAPRRDSAPERPALPKDPLSLDAAVALALVRNPALLAARAQAGIAKAEVVIAQQWPNNPELRASGAGDYAGTGRDREANVEIGLSQTFQTGGQRARREEAASHGAEATAARIADAERLLRRDVSVAYVDAVLAGRRLDVSRRQLEVAEGLLAAADLRRRAGDVSEAEASLIRLAARQAQAATLTATLDVETTSRELAALLGLRSEERVALLGTFPAARPPLAGDLEQRALARRSDLTALRLDRARAMADVEVERASRWPDVTVGVFYGFSRGSLDGSGGATLEDKDHLLGADVSVPLALFNRREGEILRATREVERIDAEIAALENAVRRDVAVALERVRALRERTALFDAAVEPLAERNLEQTREAYRIGQVGTVEVLRAQDDRLKVALSAAEARRDRAAAEAFLYAAIGGIE